jgi:hypothetical protein
MAEMEEKLGAILNSPQLMQQIMQMAQTLGSTPEPAPPPPEPTLQAGAFPSFDPALLQKIASFAGSSSVDSEQQALLNALCPYLSRDRVGKLERAMRAAKVARMASGFLGQGGLSLLTGR